MIEKAQRIHHTQEYYFSKKLKEVALLKAAGREIYNLGIGSPDLLPDVSVLNAIQDAMTDAHAHQYQSYNGLPQFRTAITQFYQRHYGVSLDPATQVLPLMGSKEGLLHIALAFLDVGSKVLIPNPGYPTYDAVVKLVGGQTVYYELNDLWEIDFDALNAMDLSGVKLMFVNYPNMPTGKAASKALFEKLIAFGKAHQILIVNDNPYSFILQEQPLSILEIDGALEVALELNSLSKTFHMSGWRVGMVLGHSAYIDAILKVKSNMDSGMFYGIQMGAIAALNLPDSWFEEQQLIYRQRQALVYEIAEKLNCKINKENSGLFVWAQVSDAVDDVSKFIDYILYNYGVFCTPGCIFGSRGNRYIRLSLCMDCADLRLVLNKLTDFVYPTIEIDTGTYTDVH